MKRLRQNSACITVSSWFNSGISRAALALNPATRHCSGMNHVSPTPFSSARPPEQVAFHRRELSVIMSVYGRMVAAGEWRDYGISMLRDVAVFSVFRRAAEHPIYRIEKRPKLAVRQQQYAVIGMDGRILKRGGNLKQVLSVLEKKLIRAVD